MAKLQLVGGTSAPQPQKKRKRAFKQGTEVQLLSGGMSMTVEYDSGSETTPCVWQDELGNVIRDTFANGALCRYKPPPPKVEEKPK